MRSHGNRVLAGACLAAAVGLVIAVVSGGPEVKARPGADKGLVQEGFVFEANDRLPSNHGSNVAQMPDNTIMCAWYAGPAEGHPEVAVYGSRLEHGEWTSPKVIADTPDRSEGNPVLFTDPSGNVWLFFVTIHGLGWNWARIKYRVSIDAGHTWGPVEVFRHKRGWMTRNHPLTLSDGRILLPLYSERKWCTEFMVTRDGGLSWGHAAEVCSDPGNIQASVVELGPGSLYALMRTGARKEGRIWETRSKDGGETWADARLTGLPNPNAATDMIKLDSGRLLLAFNNSEKRRTPLSLAVSDNKGESWRVVRDLETAEGEYSYPSLCQARDGVIHITYTFRRETIKHVAFTEEWLK